MDRVPLHHVADFIFVAVVREAQGFFMDFFDAFLAPLEAELGTRSAHVRNAHPPGVVIDPAHSARGLGTYAILRQVERARNERRGYVYLGFWLAGHPKMEYKRRFHPLEYLDGAQWKPLPDPPA